MGSTGDKTFTAQWARDVKTETPNTGTVNWWVLGGFFGIAILVSLASYRCIGK